MNLIQHNKLKKQWEDYVLYLNILVRYPVWMDQQEQKMRLTSLLERPRLFDMRW